MNRTARIGRLGKAFDPNERLQIAWMTDSHGDEGSEDDPDASGAVLGTRWYYTVGAKLRDFVDQVNADQPHFVMHTGDLIESGRQFEWFVGKWGEIDPGIANAITPGNHDFAFTPASGTRHDAIAADLGYNGNVLNAGSKFNKSYALSGNGVSARLIMLDTNIDPDTGEHVASNVGHMSDSMLTWLEGELAASSEDVILLGSHHGPHMHEWIGGESLFDTDDAMALKDIVDAEVAARPARKIRHLFGHHHIQNAVRVWDNLGPNLPGWLAPAAVELNPSNYLTLHVGADGSLGWELRTVRYPYA